MTPSSKTPVRNLQHPPSMTLRTGVSWHTSIHARDLKFGTQVKTHIYWQSMMSIMTSSSQVSSQEPSTSSKYGLRGRGVLDKLLIMLENWKLAHKTSITFHDDSWCQEWPHPPSIQSGTINILQVWLQGQVLNTHLFMLKCWNLAHKSRIIYNDDPWCQEWPRHTSIPSGTFNVL